MQMTDSFAATVAVTIPILALAAGGEARTIRERIQKPHEQWEDLYRDHQLRRPLDLEGSADDVLDHLLDLPKLPAVFRIERLIAVLGAFVWLIVFGVLTVVELLTLLWLADGEPPGHGDLAAFGLWSIGAGFLALIIAPMAYLAVPVMLVLDLIPAGLRRSLAEQAADGKGRRVAKDLAKETGSAFDRVGDRLAAQKPGKWNTMGPRKAVKLLKQELAESRGGQQTAAGDAEGDAERDAAGNAAGDAQGPVEPGADGTERA